MASRPSSQAPVATSNGVHTSPIIEVDKALESMRDSGFDLTAAAGEPIDNSIEANATVIRVAPQYSKDRQRIIELAFADNGRGIPPEMLAKVLRMGYSSRYNQRKGLGRFGVGLKLAALSLGTRIEVITNPVGSDKFYRVYLDLKEIQDGTQHEIVTEELSAWPDGYADLMVDAKGKAFESGTLVLWLNIDRLVNGGSYGTALDAKLADLRKFIARAYREFLHNGLQISAEWLEDKWVSLHDPLFLLENPRINERYVKRAGLTEAQVVGRIIEEHDIEVNGHIVHMRVAVVPEIFRFRKGDGGAKDIFGEPIREFQIEVENEGRVSMMRNDREIYYDTVPKLLPGGVIRGDRYIGIEVSFPADLDEFFQVRNVKRGAEPVSKLREAIRKWLEKPVKQARKVVREHWIDVAADDAETGEGRNPVIQESVDKAEEKAPRGQAGLDLSPDDENKIIDEIIAQSDLDPAENPQQVAALRERILARSLSIMDGSFPGRELLAIDHLNAKVVVRVNHRHPFVKEVYDPLQEVARKPYDEQDAGDMHDLISRTSVALDLLFMAYAKAENMHREPDEQYEDLRSYWGQFTAAHMKEFLKSAD